MIALAALFAAEIAIFVLRFPREPVARAIEVVRVLLGPFGRQFLILFGGATLVLGWSALREQLRLWKRPTIASLWPLVHVFAFGCCGVLAWQGLSIGPLNTPRGWLWESASVLSWAICAASAFFAVVPLRMFRGWFARNPYAFAGGAGAGVAGCFAALAAGHWQFASYWTLRVVEKLLPLLGQKVVVNAPALIIGSPVFQVYLATACSGLEGLGIAALFVCIYLYVWRRDLRFPAALMLLPIAMIVVWVFNAARIAVMVALGSVAGAAMAAVFHSMAGWVSLNVAALGIVYVSRRLPFFSRIERDDREARDNPAGVYLLPLFFIVVAAFVTRPGFDGIDRFYGARVAAAMLVLFAFRSELARFRWQPSWWALAVGIATFATWIGIDILIGGLHGDAGFNRALGRLSAGGAAAWLALRVLGGVVTVPLAEELAFRGYLLRKLIAPDFRAVTFDAFTWPSFLGSSIAFGVLHGRWIAGIIAGMLFAIAARRRGRFSDAVYAHATANALIAILVLATRNWSLWT